MADKHNQGIITEGRGNNQNNKKKGLLSIVKGFCISEFVQRVSYSMKLANQKVEGERASFGENVESLYKKWHLKLKISRIRP